MFQLISKNKIGYFLSLLLLSGASYAACPPPGPSSDSCKPEKIVENITGSAMSAVQEVVQTISESGESLAKKVAETQAQEQSVLSAIGETVIKGLGTSVEQDVNDQLEIEKVIITQKNEHQGEMLYREWLAKNKVFEADDTPEEMELIIEQLESLKGESPAKVIMLLKGVYDDGGQTIETMTLAGRKEGCSQGDGCSFSKNVNPGRKLAVAFSECSKLKKNHQAKVMSASSKIMASVEAFENQKKAFERSSPYSESLSKTVAEKDLSCSFEEKRAGLCKLDLTDEEYLDGVNKLKFGENWNVSMSNFSNPSCVSPLANQLSDDDSDLLPLCGSVLSNAEGVSESEMKINNTYRTSAQALGAIDYVNNVVSSSFVTNKTNFASKTEEALFKQAYYSRVANLSLARTALMDTFSRRVGPKVLEAWQTGSLNKGNFVQEEPKSESAYDILNNRITNEYIEANSSASVSSNFDKKVASSLALNNRISYQNIQLNENIELLLAALLASDVNSIKSINALNACREDENQCF